MKHVAVFFTLFLIGLSAFEVPSSFEQNTITLNTNSSSYGPGEVVQITGVITGAPNQLVGIQVTDSSGKLILLRTLQTDSNGTFVLKFKASTTAAPGNFEIEANARINGQVVTATKTFMQSIPEFGPTVGIISILSIISVILVSRKFRSHGSY